MQLEVAIAGRFRAARALYLARQDRNLGVVDLPVFAAHEQGDQMLSRYRLSCLRIECEARAPRVRQAREQVADIGPFHTKFGVPDLHAVEHHRNRLRWRPADHPSAERDLPRHRQVDFVAMISDARIWGRSAGGHLRD